MSIVDISKVKENGGIVFSKKEKQIYQYSELSNSWVSVGIINPQHISSSVGPNGLNFGYDSNFDALKRSMSSGINLIGVDSDGNTITWTHTIIGDPANAIVDISGTSPSFDLVPKKNLGDTSLSNQIVFNGVINVSGVDSAPRFKEINFLPLFDSAFTADSLGLRSNFIDKLEIQYFYNWEQTSVSGFNHDKAIELSTFTVPDVQFLEIKDASRTTDQYVDMQIATGSSAGSIIFLLDDNQNRLLSYPMANPYSLREIDYTQEKTLNLKSDSWNAENPSAFKFNNTGYRLFILDKTLNQIAEYWLLTPWDINTAIRKDNFKTNTTELKNIEDTYVSPDGKYYYTLETPVISLEPSGTTNTFEGSRGMPKSVNAGTIKRYTLYDSGQIHTLSVDSNAITKSFETGFYTHTFVEDGVVLGSSGIASRARAGARIRGSTFVSTGRKYISTFEHYGLPQSMCFNYDGTKMYTGEAIAAVDGKFRQYTLTSPWDVSTAVAFDSATHEIGTKMNSLSLEDPSPSFGVDLSQSDGFATRRPHGPESIRFNPDGNKFYVLNKKLNQIYQYNLNITTDSNLFNISQLTQPITSLSKEISAGGWDLKIELNSLGSPASKIGQDLGTFNTINIIDSNKMIISGDKYLHTVQLNQFNLVSSLIQSDSNVSMDSSNSIFGVNIVDDKILVHDDSGTINQWKMTTLNDPSTAVREHTNKIKTLNVGTGGYIIGASGLAIDSDRSKFYIGAGTGFEIHKYSFNANAGVSSMSLDSMWEEDSLGIVGISALNLRNNTLNFSSENKIREIDIDHNILNSSVLDSAILTLASPSEAAAFGVDWNGNGSELITTGRSDLSSTATSSVQSFGVKNSYSIKSV